MPDVNYCLSSGDCLQNLRPAVCMYLQYPPTWPVIYGTHDMYVRIYVCTSVLFSDIAHDASHSSLHLILPIDLHAIYLAYIFMLYWIGSQNPLSRPLYILLRLVRPYMRVSTSCIFQDWSLSIYPPVHWQAIKLGYGIFFMRMTQQDPYSARVISCHVMSRRVLASYHVNVVTSPHVLFEKGLEETIDFSLSSRG